MKRDDPIRLKLRAEREDAQVRLNILSLGIGHALIKSYDESETRLILDYANKELPHAIKACEKADEAYRPYWSRRRVRVHRPPKRKRKKPTK